MARDPKKTFKNSLLIVFFAFIALYGLLGARGIIWGIKLKDVKIENKSENVLNISGNAKNAVHLSLNGRTISIDQAGNFNETIALLSGYNIIGIEAQDKFGNQDEKNYKLMYQPAKYGNQNSDEEKG